MSQHDWVLGRPNESGRAVRGRPDEARRTQSGRGDRDSRIRCAVDSGLLHGRARPADHGRDRPDQLHRGCSRARVAEEEIVGYFEKEILQLFPGAGNIRENPSKHTIYFTLRDPANAVHIVIDKVFLENLDVAFGTNKVTITARPAILYDLVPATPGVNISVILMEVVFPDDKGVQRI
jgi:hypothetical protein